MGRRKKAEESADVSQAVEVRRSSRLAAKERVNYNVDDAFKRIIAVKQGGHRKSKSQSSETKKEQGKAKESAKKNPPARIIMVRQTTSTQSFASNKGRNASPKAQTVPSTPWTTGSQRPNTTRVTAKQPKDTRRSPRKAARTDPSLTLPTPPMTPPMSSSDTVSSRSTATSTTSAKDRTQTSTTPVARPRNVRPKRRTRKDRVATSIPEVQEDRSISAEDFMYEQLAMIEDRRKEAARKVAADQDELPRTPVKRKETERTAEDSQDASLPLTPTSMLESHGWDDVPSTLQPQPATVSLPLATVPEEEEGTPAKRRRTRTLNPPAVALPSPQVASRVQSGRKGKEKTTRNSRAAREPSVIFVRQTTKIQKIVIPTHKKELIYDEADEENGADDDFMRDTIGKEPTSDPVLNALSLLVPNSSSSMSRRSGRLSCESWAPLTSEQEQERLAIAEELGLDETCEPSTSSPTEDNSQTIFPGTPKEIRHSSTQPTVLTDNFLSPSPSPTPRRHRYRSFFNTPPRDSEKEAKAGRRLAHSVNLRKALAESKWTPASRTLQGASFTATTSKEGRRPKIQFPALAPLPSDDEETANEEGKGETPRRRPLKKKKEHKYGLDLDKLKKASEKLMSKEGRVAEETGSDGEEDDDDDSHADE